MNTKKGFVVELAEGKVKEGVQTQECLKASDNLMADLRGLDGYIRRELWLGENGQFVDVVYWDDLESAQGAAEVFPTYPCKRTMSSRSPSRACAFFDEIFVHLHTRR